MLKNLDYRESPKDMNISDIYISGERCGQGRVYFQKFLKNNPNNSLQKKKRTSVNKRTTSAREL